MSRTAVPARHSRRSSWLVLLLAVSAAVPAKEPAEDRYPWDTSPATCPTDSSSRKSAEICIVDNWRTFDETVDRLTLLFEQERFSLLDRALADIMASDKRFVSGRPASSAAYWTFRRLMSGGVTAPVFQRMVSWRRTCPDSYFAKFVEARSKYSMGWSVRGGGYRDTVAEESWKLFDSALRGAQQDLLAAPRELKETPLWHNLMLAIALDIRNPRQNPQEIFESGVMRWPHYYDFYDLMISRLEPRWGGSWDQVDTFIRQWTRRQEKSEGKSLYARLYINLKLLNVDPEQTRISWIMMRSSFRDLLARYPDPAFKNAYASYACLAKDRAEYARAIKMVDEDRVLRGEWLRGTSYEQCSEWAERAT
ncbi:MAG TPA: DUF4034 domain-containing protein [Steroidobacteraceae bacterium]|nr:DUF4034 domain-containing protein [Steroidobacteraceae bacterium]HRX88875.1 DUF4034 domain-containing protein [Steroidobacteraceae bacterium]